MSVTFDGERNEVKEDRPLRTSGGSVVVSIPPQVLEAVGADAGNEITVAADLDGSDTIELRTNEE